MKFLVEQIAPQEEEEVRVRCHDTEEKWVEAIRAVTAGEASVIGISDGKRYRLRLRDIFYFEIVEGRSFLYCPSVSGRFEATLVNQEKVIISHQYVGELKRMLGI